MKDQAGSEVVCDTVAGYANTLCLSGAEDFQRNGVESEDDGLVSGTLRPPCVFAAELQFGCGGDVVIVGELQPEGAQSITTLTPSRCARARNSPTENAASRGPRRPTMTTSSMPDCVRALRAWSAISAAARCSRPARRPTDKDLLDACADRIARYKVPKLIVRTAQIARSPAGKPDYRWAAAMAAAAPEGEAAVRTAPRDPD